MNIELETIATAQDKIMSMRPYVVLFREALLEAVNLGVSDIHIESQESEVLVRFRLHGELFTWKSLKKVYQQGFLNDVKSVTEFPIAVSGRPLDSSAYYPKWKVKLRGSLLPSIHGENIVFRIIDLNREITLENRNFSLETTEVLRNLLRTKTGLVVFSGETGSGKSSTLNALMREINDGNRKLITIEDPDEYPIPNATQVRVNSKLSFADALRACMRHDPNIILIGEIRDKETAKIAIDAAVTGHLVFSTIHANGALEVPRKMIKSFEVDEYMLKSVLKFSSNQLFFSLLCECCKRPFDFSKTSNLKKREGFFEKNDQGCDACHYTGIVGRIPVMEYLQGEDLKDFLLAPDQRPSMFKNVFDKGVELSSLKPICFREVLKHQY